MCLCLLQIWFESTVPFGFIFCHLFRQGMTAGKTRRRENWIFPLNFATLCAVCGVKNDGNCVWVVHCCVPSIVVVVIAAVTATIDLCACAKCRRALSQLYQIRTTIDSLTVIVLCAVYRVCTFAGCKLCAPTPSGVRVGVCAVSNNGIFAEHMHAIDVQRNWSHLSTTNGWYVAIFCGYFFGCRTLGCCCCCCGSFGSRWAFNRPIYTLWKSCRFNNIFSLLDTLPSSVALARKHECQF